MIQVRTERDAYTPGETISGSITWDSGETDSRIELRLIWYTSGKGTTDYKICDSAIYEDLSGSGQAEFAFQAPVYPNSYSGTLISIQWALEAIRFPDRYSTRVDLTIGPDAREIVAGSVSQ